MPSPDRYVCAFCPSRRKTREGIESHLLHRHPAEYQRFVDGTLIDLFTRLP